MEFRIQMKDITGSTNDDVWALAEAGEPAGAVIAARQQSSGRGQFKRAWIGPKGGLYFSALIRPESPVSDWAAFSPAIAYEFAQVIRDYCHVGEDKVWVKHPNDVLCAEGKLCGILPEARGNAIVVGCGINVFRPEGGITTDGRNIAAFMCDLPDKPLQYSDSAVDELLVLFLGALDRAAKSVGLYK